MAIFILHVILALVLFFCVNWIGKHAVDFGYTSTTLFEEPNESVALNFFLRALAPAVFVIAVSSVAVSLGYPSLRLGIFWIAIYYYALRAGIIFLLNRQGLISWTRYLLHAAVGISATQIAYLYLILPNRSLVPDLDQAGNELWLAILAFLYAVANKVPLSNGPGVRRRNQFVARHYVQARAKFGPQIESTISDSLLRLVAYSILVYEDYCRPPNIRQIERIAWWKTRRTTGIMQVAAEKPLSDYESVQAGIGIIVKSWENSAGLEYVSERVRSTIADYNRDDDYIGRVFEVMEILAKRADPTFESAYDRIWE